MLIISLAPLAAFAARALQPEDWYRFQALSDLQIAPDGASVAYLVTSYDKEADESRSALWSADWAHGEGRPLTHGESVWEPRFSPDGRYLSFLAARPAGQRHAAVAARPPRRRGARGEPRERRDQRLRMVARRRARGAGDERRG